jgi:hypothetical protein
LFLISIFQTFLGASELTVLVQDLPSYFPTLAVLITPTTCLILGLILLFQSRFSNAKDDDARKLPFFTQKELEIRIAEGQQWVIIHDVIYEISSFMERHPGGSKIISDNIGKDVSMFFGGVDKELIQSGKNAVTHSHSRLALNHAASLEIGRTKISGKNGSQTSLKLVSKSAQSIGHEEDLEGGIVAAGQESMPRARAPSMHSLHSRSPSIAGEQFQGLTILESTSCMTTGAGSNYDTVLFLRIALPKGMSYLNGPGISYRNITLQDATSNCNAPGAE